MDTEQLLKALRLIDALKKGNGSELIKQLPFEGNKQIADLMNLLPSVMGSMGAGYGKSSSTSGRDAEIFRLWQTGHVKRG